MPPDVNGFDLAVLRAVNGGGPWWLDELFLLFSSRYAAAVAGVGALILLVVRCRVAALRVAVAAALALGISDAVGNQLLKPLIGRVRPCYLLPGDEVRVLASAANVGSMPSLHAANAFAVAFVLAMLDRRLAIVVYPVAVLVAMSRVYLGVHWPTDVLGGAIWGTLAGIAGWWLSGKANSAAARRWTSRASLPDKESPSEASCSPRPSVPPLE